jgi:hypothetical protein
MCVLLFGVFQSHKILPTRGINPTFNSQFSTKQVAKLLQVLPY